MVKLRTTGFSGIGSNDVASTVIFEFYYFFVSKNDNKIVVSKIGLWSTLTVYYDWWIL